MTGITSITRKSARLYLEDRLFLHYLIPRHQRVLLRHYNHVYEAHFCGYAPTSLQYCVREGKSSFTFPIGSSSANLHLSLKVFMTREDTLACVHEPFGDAFYFGPERLSTRYENDEAARKASGFSESTFKTILERIERESKEVRFKFSMLHLPYFLDSSNLIFRCYSTRDWAYLFSSKSSCLSCSWKFPLLWSFTLSLPSSQ